MGVADLAMRSSRFFDRLTVVHVLAYRASGGLIGSRIPGVGGPMLLLDHVGARSGQRRTTPLLYVPHGEDVAIIASKGGNPKNPAWYHNLRANPETTVQIGRERRKVRARVTSGSERDRLYAEATRLYGGYADYQARTERTIPVVVLERAG